MRYTANYWLASLAIAFILAIGSQARSQDSFVSPDFTPYYEPQPPLEPSGSVEDQMQQMQQRMNQLQEQVNYLQGGGAPGVHPPAAPPPKPAPAPNPAFPTVKLSGVFQADVGFFNQDDVSRATYGQIQDGADFRRARLGASGSLTENYKYFFQLDFAAFGRPTFTDVWVEQNDVPVFGNVRIGQWKQPFSLEVVSSFRYTTFMERSVLFQPFTPFRHLGVGFYNHSDDLNWTWAASGFRTGQDQFGDSISTTGGWGTAERITYLPWWDEASDGRGYMHLGLGHFFSNPPNHSVNFRTIPELFIGENAPGVVGTSGQAVPGALNGTPFFVSTGPLAVNSYNIVGTELLYVHGAFSLQSEVMVNQVNNVGLGGDSTFWGYYAQAGYFLTGEHRPYDRKAGAIDRVKPFENFFSVETADGVCTGWGAWEVACRVSHLDLNDSGSGIAGGRITDLTGGVNWYMNPYTKAVFNYIHSFSERPQFGDANTDIAAARIQMDF